jgi:hypothetical protein
LGNRLGTSPLVRMLFTSSRNASYLICRNAAGCSVSQCRVCGCQPVSVLLCQLALMPHRSALAGLTCACPASAKRTKPYL